VVLARFLGPVEFGIIGTAYAYGALLVILSDFGFAVFAFREASANSASAGAVVLRCLEVKGVIAALFVLLTLVYLVIVQDSADEGAIFTLIFFGLMIASFGDLAFILVRISGRFGAEACAALLTSVISLVALGLASAWWRDAMLSSQVFFGTRCVYTLVAFVVVRPEMRARKTGWKAPSLARMLRLSSTYAIDSVLVNLNGQVDLLVVGALLDPHSVGIYQAGGRLVQVISPFATALSTVHLPKLVASWTSGRAKFQKEGRKVSLEFAGLAILAGLAFLIVGPVVTRYVYGQAYDQLFELWPGFAAFVFVRLLLAGFGIQLVAAGEIQIRIGAQIISLCIFGLSAYFVLPEHGVIATPWLLAGASLVALGAYGYAMIKRTSP
jgi:O-antigen/teichoic acid export membrane protein